MGGAKKNQVCKILLVRTTVVLLFICAIMQLCFNVPIGRIMSPFIDSEKLSRYLSARIFFSACLAIYLFCTFTLIKRRIQNKKYFNLPYRGEILLHVGSIMIISISGMPLAPNFDGVEHLLRTLEYWSYIGACSIAVGWLSFVRVVFWGNKKEQQDIDVYLRGITGMRLNE